MAVDYIVFFFIAVAAFFGFVRGIVSQIMAILGLITSFLFAPSIGQLFGGFFQHHFGCSKFMGDKIATFLVGATIYLTARFIGFLTHRFFARHIEGYKKINRLGGALFGATKGVLLIMVIFFFIALIPREY